MYKYRQSTGQLWSAAGVVVSANCYAGGNIPPHFDPTAKNNPARQEEHCTGPLPRGRYTIGPPHNEPTLGPCSMYLQPEPDNAMFGRSGFFIHGDSAAHPGEASEGCIVAPPLTRSILALSLDHQLQVVE